jgi:spore coat protein U-like protein
MKSVMKGRRALSLLVLGGCLVQLNTASAVPLNVTATIDDFCELGTMGDVAFGTLTPGTGTDATANGAVEWRCSNGTNADINIDNGGNGDRTMDHATTASTLAYQLFKDAARTQVWSDSGTDLSVTGAGIGPGFASEVVYGRILAGDVDAAEVGDYDDQVDVTINVVP